MGGHPSSLRGCGGVRVGDVIRLSLSPGPEGTESRGGFSCLRQTRFSPTFHHFPAKTRDWACCITLSPPLPSKCCNSLDNTELSAPIPDRIFYCLLPHHTFWKEKKTSISMTIFNKVEKFNVYHLSILKCRTRRTSVSLKSILFYLNYIFLFV